MNASLATGMDVQNVRLYYFPNRRLLYTINQSRFSVCIALLSTFPSVLAFIMIKLVLSLVHPIALLCMLRFVKEVNYTIWLHIILTGGTRLIGSLFAAHISRGENSFWYKSVALSLDEYKVLHPRTKVFVSFCEFKACVKETVSISIKCISSIFPCIISIFIHCAMLVRYSNSVGCLRYVALVAAAIPVLLTLQRKLVQNREAAIEVAWEISRKNISTRTSIAESLITAQLIATSSILPPLSERLEHVSRWWDMYFIKQRYAAIALLVGMAALLCITWLAELNETSTINLALLTERIASGIMQLTGDSTIGADSLIKEKELQSIMLKDHREFESDEAESGTEQPRVEFDASAGCTKLYVRSMPSCMCLQGRCFQQGDHILVRGSSGIGKTYCLKQMLGMPLSREQCEQMEGLAPRETSDSEAIRWPLLFSTYADKTRRISLGAPSATLAADGVHRNVQLSELVMYVTQGESSRLAMDVRDLFVMLDGHGQIDNNLAISSLTCCDMQSWFRQQCNKSLDVPVKSTISGGEKSRLFLAAALHSFIRGANRGEKYVLVLDEADANLGASSFASILVNVFEILPQPVILYVVSHNIIHNSVEWTHVLDLDGNASDLQG